MKHTATPWEVYGNAWYGIKSDNIRIAAIFGLEEEQANAAFIVKACNAHDELLAALKDAAYWLEPGTSPKVDAERVIASMEGGKA